MDTSNEEKKSQVHILTQSEITKNALGRSTEGKRKNYFWKTEIFVLRNWGFSFSYITGEVIDLLRKLRH